MDHYVTLPLSCHVLLLEIVTALEYVIIDDLQAIVRFSSSLNSDTINVFEALLVWILHYSLVSELLYLASSFPRVVTNRWYQIITLIPSKNMPY
jgi:hypothetical protein